MRNILETETNALYLRVLVPVLVAHVLYKCCFWLYGKRCLKLCRCVSWKCLWTAWNMSTVREICGLWLVVSHRDPSKHFWQLCYLNCLWIKIMQWNVGDRHFKSCLYLIKYLASNSNLKEKRWEARILGFWLVNPCAHLCHEKHMLEKVQKLVVCKIPGSL